MEQVLLSLLEPLPEDVGRMIQDPDQMMNRFNELITQLSGGVDSHIQDFANSLFNDQPDIPRKTTPIKIIDYLEEINVGNDHEDCCICLCGFNCGKDVSKMTLKDMKKILDKRGVCYVNFIEKTEFREAIGPNKTSIAIRLPCEHEFHPKCIQEWLKRDHRCPVCRYELPTIDGHVGADTINDQVDSEDSSEDNSEEPEHSNSAPLACPDWIEQDHWDEIPYDIQLELMGFPAV